MTKIIVIAKRSYGNRNNKKLRTKTGKNSKNYLDFSAANKMIHKFLTCDRIKTIEIEHPKYTRKELAKSLGITTRELQKVKKMHCYRSMANKINLPLISLYCATKWV